MNTKKMLLALLICGISIPSHTWADIGGTVFREYPVNGTSLNTYGFQDTNEAGIDGITVTITDAVGTNVVPTTPMTNGSWSITTVGLAAYTLPLRVEYTGIPAYLKSSPVNTGSNTTVQFISSDGLSANLGLHNPVDYVDSTDPQFVSAAYVNGDPLKPTAGGTPASGWNSVYVFNDSDSDLYNPATFDSIATMGDVGSVWGMAHQRSTNTVYAAALVKRHVGLGSIDGTNSTTGGIYAINTATSTTTPWLDLNDLGINTGADPHGGLLPADIETPNTDVAAFAAVGKTGLGDIDLSEDDATLYVMDLANRQLVSIDVASKTASATTAVPTTGLSTTAGTCQTDDVRPFAVKVKDGEVYIGVVCSAENSRNLNDLHAYMMQLNGGAFTTVFDFPLNFSRGTDYVPVNQNWQPWGRDWGDVTNGGSWPTHVMSPMFSDIEFDTDGSLILGFMDRGGHQIGAFNHQGINGDVSLGTEGYAQGDIYRACPNGVGGWLLESNGTCGGVTTAGADNGEGPGGGEYYLGDYGRSAAFHLNSSMGGLAIVPGSGRVATTMLDPLLASDFPSFSDTARQMGIKWLSNTTGDHLQGYTLVPFTNNGGGDGTFSKAHGMGELEILSAPAPLEIGNRVWLDTDGDGIQDAGESGIAGVTVELVSGSTVIDTATTDASGNYVFSNNPAGATTASHRYNIAGLTADTAYTVRIPNVSGASKQAALGANVLTGSNTGEGSVPDQNDSDGATSGDNAEATIAAADIPYSGANNHTYDFGFRNAPSNVDLAITKTANPTTASSGDTVIYTITVVNNGTTDATVIEATDQLPAGVTYVSDTPSQGSYNLGTGIWTVGDLAIGATATLEIEVTVN